MDNFTRLVAYLIVGTVLLYCNILYLRAWRLMFSPNDYVILPIRLLGQSNQDDSRGIALAQMLQARLKTLEGSLADAQEQLSTPQPTKPLVRTASPSMMLPSMMPLISTDTVRMPTSLLEPANINVSVGGVQVGGVIPWIQNLLVRQRTLAFTFYTVDQNTTIISGDATPLSAGGNGAIWFESSGSQDKAVSDLAWALLLKHVRSTSSRVDSILSLTAFQVLGNGLIDAAVLKRKTADGLLVPSDEFDVIFQRVWPVARDVAGWPELKYFAASLAENAGETERAALLYKTFREAGLSDGASSTVAAIVKDERLDEKIARLSASVAPSTTTPDKPFDVRTTQEGSTTHCSVYYETALGGAGSAIAKGVMSKFDGDFDKLTEIFGGTKPPRSFNLVIKSIDPKGEGLGGTYHYSCSDETLYCDAKIRPALDPEVSSFLSVSQAVDVFAAFQNKGWKCGYSNGAGLKRVLAASLYPGKSKGWEIAYVWLDTRDRPDCSGPTYLR